MFLDSMTGFRTDLEFGHFAHYLLFNLREYHVTKKLRDIHLDMDISKVAQHFRITFSFVQLYNFRFTPLFRFIFRIPYFFIQIEQRIFKI